jgi:four helix bundle protein
MKKPKINEWLFQCADKSFEFAVDIVKVYESMGENKQKFQARQFLRYGTQIGAKVVRSGTDYTRQGFINCFAIAFRRANETRYWLKAVYDSGFIEQAVFEKYDSHLNHLCMLMDTFLKKIRLNKAILSLEKSKISDRSLLQYFYN